MTSELQCHNPLGRLETALDVQRSYLQPYEKRSEVIAYETLRAFDDLFLRDLMEPTRRVEEDDRRFRALSTWGVNHALQRVVPRMPAVEPFRNFPSRSDNQAKTDDFIFHCAMLELGERYAGWLRDGILSGTVRSYKREGMDVLVLKAEHPSYSTEEIGIEGLRWASGQVWANDRGKEQRLENRHRKVSKELQRRVDLIGGWLVTYSTSPEIDQYFSDWAKLYLRRIYSQDMIGAEELIGGRPFSRYIDVLTALSARSQKHIAFAAILRARYPGVDIRNLLTTYANRDYFLDSLAGYLDADRQEIEEILLSLTLSGENLDIHTKGDETVWAPIVQSSATTFTLPIYGLDINPFLFLLNDLRFRYKDDWFKIANNREARWIVELEDLFFGPRWETNGRNLKLRSDGKIETDIDFAVLDRKSNELAIIQLKWQHPVGLSNRARRSTGKNFITESNRWVEKVTSWLDRYGSAELTKRLGFSASQAPSVHLFVVGRYHAYFSGFDDHDSRAVWSDWSHFRQARLSAPRRSISQFSSDLRTGIDKSRANAKGESTMFPVGDLALIINPLSEPADDAG
jgi:virulence-associated protein VagC